MPRRGSPEEGIRVVALSLDETSTRRFISRHGSTFPVDPSADGPHVRELTGAFVNPDPESIQETGFVLPPDGRVVVSVYFSGVIGRLTPEEVTGLVRYLRLHDSAAGCTGLPAGGEPVGLRRIELPTAGWYGCCHRRRTPAVVG